MLLSTGERISCALCAMAINDLGHQRDLADRLAGRHRHRQVAHQGAHPRRARRPHPRRRSTRTRSCSSPASRASRPRSDVTTLGRGGSDTTAVAARRGARTPRCARSTPTSPASSRPTRGSSPTPASSPVVSFEEMLEMAASGAGVLQLRSVEYARNHGVRIHCRSSLQRGPRYLCRRRGRDHGTTTDHSRHPLHRRGAHHAARRPGQPGRRAAASSPRSPTRTSTST